MISYKKGLLSKLKIVILAFAIMMGCFEYGGRDEHLDISPGFIYYIDLAFDEPITLDVYYGFYGENGSAYLTWEAIGGQMINVSEDGHHAEFLPERNIDQATIKAQLVTDYKVLKDRLVLEFSWTDSSYTILYPRDNDFYE